MNKSQIGHAMMCVRLKLRADQRRVFKPTVPPDARPKILARIERGEATLAALDRLSKDCDHSGAIMPTPNGRWCTTCGAKLDG